jgi:hypothetical protein
VKVSAENNRSEVHDGGTRLRKGEQEKGSLAKHGVKKQEIDVENYPIEMMEALWKWAFQGREGAKNRVYFLARLA